MSRCPAQTLLAGCLAGLILIPGAATAQEVGPPERLDVAGLVAETQTGAPVAGAAVSIEGTAVRTLTNDAGRFVLRGIPPGEQTWVIERLGYATWRQPLTVQHLDQLRIGLLARPVALDAIRVTIDRLEERRRLAPYSIHTQSREALRSAVATTAAEIIRSRTPWPLASCGAAQSTGYVPSSDATNAPDETTLLDSGPDLGLDLCVRYRGRVVKPMVCLDDRPVPTEFLVAYGAPEIYAIDYIGGPRPQVRLYTELFLERGRRIRPIALGCR